MQYSNLLKLALASTISVTQAASLADICTTSNIKAALPADQSINDIVFHPSSVTATPVYNANVGGVTSYCRCEPLLWSCNENDNVVVKYALPDPGNFKNRFYVHGGGGYVLSRTTTGGLSYGAVSGATDAGYDAFDKSFDQVVLYGNNSLNWDATLMFAFKALGELTLIGKALTKNIYHMADSTKLFTYFEGCSDGAREGFSQIQRYGTQYDGLVAAAPAFRYAHQQVLHTFSSVAEHLQNYYPQPCEMIQIVKSTIAACDELDGRKDGVVARTDLCMLNFKTSSLVGTPYSCAASTNPSQPAQSGQVSAEGATLAQTILDGLHNSQGQRAYLSWQISSEFEDAYTVYNTNTGTWDLSIPYFGGGFVTKFVELLDIDNLPNLDGVTYDTVVDWINVAFSRYNDTLQTTIPNLIDFQSHGGKIIHFHGESDPSIPAASSVHYRQSVKCVMYGDNPNSETELNSWYQFYLVPGAAHCGYNPLQPGPYPQTAMASMIAWVEQGIAPTSLGATVNSGPFNGEVQQLCMWPTRPLWLTKGSTFNCVYDQQSIDTWTYNLPAFEGPVY
ncbi:hypothetical protein AMS68_002139 [Peltaster fructicola]|uniref:Carboxylic ester hydrolase n=1 Tax=Peltaster fructicola TaxID=286661 RepID=A0A6H0XPD1_9PEZI|nr:hypothetical protein AMS68_002139 [Peltaster fructicola]